MVIGYARHRGDCVDAVSAPGLGERIRTRRTGDKGQPSVHEEPLDGVRRCDGAHAGAPAGGACAAGGNTDCGGGKGGRTGKPGRSPRMDGYIPYTYTRRRYIFETRVAAYLAPNPAFDGYEIALNT